MSGTLVDSAKRWLNEAEYIKVFKPWWEVFEDFASRGLFTIGVLGLVVRYFGGLDSGVLQCVLISLEGPTHEDVEIPGPSINLALAAYASMNHICTRRLVSIFAMYGPIILFGQAMILIYLERVIFHFPTISGKLEKFYKAVVLQATEGEDCNLVEDFNKTQGEALNSIIRKRQRDEICASLKKSSLLFCVYLMHNTLQVIYAVGFFILNAYYANQLYGHETDHGTCQLPIDDFKSDHKWLDPLMIHTRKANLQCQQKRLDFFVMLIIVNCVCLCIFMCCALTSVLWIVLPRISTMGRVSNIFRRLQLQNKDLIKYEGRDFLFLFDLLSHTQGLPATLRILSHCSPTFAEICEPDIDPTTGLVKTEHTLQVSWRRSRLQKFTQDENEDLVTQYNVSLASSDNQEFPGGIIEEEILVKGENEAMTVKFLELKGADTLYTVTISPVINSSRLKGKRMKTKLVQSSVREQQNVIMIN